MKNQPLLTVIVPCYNVDKYVDKCISSIVNQTYSNLDILLIDDGSTDTTGMICDAWQEREKRIRVIHKQNEGASYARKIGIENATAAYITFVDADDWIDLNMYADMMSALLSTNSEIALCDLRYIYDDGRTEGRVDNYSNSIKTLGHSEGVVLVLNDSWHTSLGTKIYKKHLFDNVKFPIGRVYGEDLIIHDIFRNASQSVQLDTVYYFYYQRSSSISHECSIAVELKKVSDFYDAHLERYLFVKQNTEYQSALQFVAYQTTHLGISLLRNMIAFPQHFTGERYKLKANELRSIPFYEYRGRLKRIFKIEIFVLKFSPILYKLLIMMCVHIIRFTNRLKLTNLRTSWFLTDNNFWK